MSKPNISQEELRKKYNAYATRHPHPMRFETWLYFREQGANGGRAAQKSRTPEERSAACKAAAEARWGKK